MCLMHFGECSHQFLRLSIPFWSHDHPLLLSLKASRCPLHLKRVFGPVAAAKQSRPYRPVSTFTLPYGGPSCTNTVGHTVTLSQSRSWVRGSKVQWVAPCPAKL